MVGQSSSSVIGTMVNKKWLECLYLDFPTTSYIKLVKEIALLEIKNKDLIHYVMLLSSRIIQKVNISAWCPEARNEHVAIAFKAICTLKSCAFQYVNSQCQHDSLPLKLAAKLDLFTEPTKSPTDYLISGSFTMYILFPNRWSCRCCGGSGCRSSSRCRWWRSAFLLVRWCASQRLALP